MKQYAWFVLAIKVVGVLLIGLSVSDLLYPLQLFGMLLDNGVGYTPSAQAYFIWALEGLGPIVQFAFGLYLLFGGQWIINRALHVVDGRCASCGYDTRGLNVEVCPECGVGLEQSQTPPRTSHDPDGPPPRDVPPSSTTSKEEAR
jgi:hypothetical protein